MQENKIDYPFIDINELKPYENNARLHPQEQINKIVNSIKEFGFITPVIIDENNTILVGHGRTQAAKAAGLTKIPYRRITNLTDEQKRAYILADNKLSDIAEWDEELLKIELENISLDMTAFGFDDFTIDIDEDTEAEVVEDETPEPPEEPRAQLGDLYKLGKHRLLCGDSTDIAVIDRLMDRVKADMVFTDPPYGVAYTGGMKIENGKIESNGKKQIKNDSLDYENLYQFLCNVFANIKVHTKGKSAVYVFYAHSRSREFLNAFHDAGLKQRSIIIWHKTSGGFGDFMAQYMNAYEPCIYGSNGETVNWYGATNEKTVWDMDKEKKCDLHPTMKPIELVGRAIKNSSKKDDVVLDCFGGSGSTLIACEQLGRTCYMCELDPKYVDVIIERWENLTGQKAELIKGGE